MIQRFRDASPGFPASAYENVFTNALGEERVIAWQTAPLVDQNGDVVRIVAGGIDITDRKHRELELQRQWDFATTVANTIPSFIVITDHDAVVVAAGREPRLLRRVRALARRSSRGRRSSTSSRARTSSPRAWRSPGRRTACRRPSASRAG